MVLDVPVGATAKIRDRRAALRLRKLFEFVAAKLDVVLDIVITDGSQPIGRGVGPVLEMRDVLAVLGNDANAPVDLREKSINLAGRLLEMDPAVRGGTGETRARELLASGAAHAKLEQIAASQGEPPRQALIGGLIEEVRASRSGWIEEIDCLRIARLARTAGAPTDPGAGIELLRMQGESVRAGDPLFRLYGDDPADFAMAVAGAAEGPGYRIG
jgi:thymidine phosphorylase